MSASTPFASQCDEEVPTSCAEEQVLHVREPTTRFRGVWKVAAAATSVCLIAAAGSWWKRATIQDRGEGVLAFAGDDITVLPHAMTFDASRATGCVEWEQNEISRSQVGSREECADLCSQDAECTAFNWQEVPCELGWFVPGGCLLLRGSCSTETNVCWELNYKTDDGGEEIVVTQTLEVMTDAPEEDIEQAMQESLEAEGIFPVEVTISTRRRLGDNERGLHETTSRGVLLTWLFCTSAGRRLAEADGRQLWSQSAEFAYDFAATLASDAGALQAFTATVSGNLQAATSFTITKADEPVMEEAGTTETPFEFTTTAP